MKRIIIAAGYLLTSFYAAAQADPGPQALKAHIEEFRKAHNTGNAEAIHAFVVSLIPTKTDLNKAISSYIPDETFELLYGVYTPMKQVTLEQIRNGSTDKISNEEIVITPASVKDLVTCRPGSDVSKYFPRDAIGLAINGTLKSGTTFYRATIGDPAKRDTFGMELIFWSGSDANDPNAGWRSLYPVWEKLPSQKPVYPPAANAPIPQQELFLAAMKSRLIENQNYIKILTNKQQASQTVMENTTNNQIKALENLKLIRAGLKKRSCEKFSGDLETRIKRLENVIKFSKFQMPSVDIDAVKKNVEIKKQIEKLEQELKYLKLAKAAQLKSMNSPGKLSQEQMELLEKELAETDGFITAKETQILQLKKQVE